MVVTGTASDYRTATELAERLGDGRGEAKRHRQALEDVGMTKNLPVSEIEGEQR